MNKVAICSVWNGAVWMPYCLDWACDYFDRVIIQEANWTSDDSRWRGFTSPDGTAAIVRDYQTRHPNLEFYQLGRWTGGCLAARAELCSHVPADTSFVYVLDVDEFQNPAFLKFLDQNLERFWQEGYTTISQHTRSFYYDFSRHTVEGFTRWFRYYEGLNCWASHYSQPKDFSVPVERGPLEPLADEMNDEIFHYSYVPAPGVEIKGAQSFDVSKERYQSWYAGTYRKFNGSNLDEVYAGNQGGIHVFGGLALQPPYTGDHPPVLDRHPLRFARWDGEQYLGLHGEPVRLSGWWNR